MALQKLLGDAVVGKDGKSVAVSSIESDAEVLGLYFSAHWCPPCRGFTPVLSEWYTKLQAAGKKLQIVFVSSDREESACADYYNSMPWLLLPYADRGTKDKLSKEYGISGIPTLVLIDAKSGELITKNGRGIVSSDPEGDKMPWKE